MPKKPVRLARPPPVADDVVDNNGPVYQESPFKLISELLADTDSNLPNEQIDEDIALFSEYGDNNDWRGIERHFRSLASLSRRASTYDKWDNRFKLANYLIACANGVLGDLQAYLLDYFEKKESGEHQINPAFVNTVSMLVILIQRLTVQIQLHVSKRNSTLSQPRGKAGKVKNTNEEDSYLERWKDQRSSLIDHLVELLEFRVETFNGQRKKALRHLFSPETIEKDFLMRFMDTVSGLMEDPENAARSSQKWIKHYLRIWRALATNFGMSIDIAKSFFTDTLELNYLDNASTFPFIEPLVELMKEEQSGERHERTNVLRNLFVMIVRRAVGLYDGDRAEHLPPKAYCMIIQGLAIHAPDVMLQEINQVYKLLNNPHQSVRTACLQALHDMFASTYLSPKYCSEYKSRKEKRLGIFQRLVSHCNDEGTNVRARAVTLVRSLMESKNFPQEFEASGFLSIVGSRLGDRSVMVRKSAMQFLAYYLEKQQHGHDFCREAHIVKLDEKTRQLRLMSTARSRIIQESEEFFNTLSFEMKSTMKKELISLIKGEVRDDGKETTHSTLFKHLKEPSCQRGLLKLYATRKDFPFHEGFQPGNESYGLAHVDEGVKHVMDSARADYCIYKTNELLNDHDLAMEAAQNDEDLSHECLQLRAQIQQLIDKMCIEMELAGCVKLSLRCILMGDTAEIKEGIKFLTRCKNFGITGADDAIRSMFSLVWRPAADVKDELIEAAEEMFISKLGGSDKAAERDKSTVENLMSAMMGVSETERPSVEEVIHLLAAPELEIDDGRPVKNRRKRRTLEIGVISKLWNIALDASYGNDAAKVVALRVLYPISKTEKGLPEARSRLRSIQKRLVESPAVAVEALRIISILGRPTEQEKGPDAYNRPIFRIHPDDSLFRSIEQLFFYEVIKADDNPERDWFNIIRLTISCILNVSMDVNVMLPKLAANFLYRAKKISEFYMFYHKQADKADDTVEKEVAATRRDYWALTWCRVMEKLMAFCGEVAIQLHAYIQLTVPRLHNRYVTKIVEAERNDSNIRDEPPRFLSDLEKSVAQKKTIFKIPEDVSTGGASDLHHLVSLMCDKRLFVPTKLLGRLLPIVVYTMRTKTMPARVQQAACVAFAKFMPLSSEISSFGAPSFFSIMHNSPSSLLRCNMVAASCDFAFAQPTLFELYSPSLFKMSSDKSAAARESAILVLSNLVSAEMLQARGALSEPARCIADPARPVREAAQSFFKEVLSRQEVIGQLLPEFMYRLASSEERLSLKSYKTVFEFFCSNLKEKTKTNAEAMIDRVCTKFSNIDMNDTDAPKYLLVALNKFAQSEGGLQRLHENWRHWSKFLCTQSVAREYKSMIEHMHNMSKSEEYKSQCLELIASIDKIQEEGLRQEDIADAPAKKSNRGKKPGATRDSSAGPSQRAPRRKRRVRETPPEASDEEEESEGEEESDD